MEDEVASVGEVNRGDLSVLVLLVILVDKSDNYGGFVEETNGDLGWGENHGIEWPSESGLREGISGAMMGTA